MTTTTPLLFVHSSPSPLRTYHSLTPSTLHNASKATSPTHSPTPPPAPPPRCCAPVPAYFNSTWYKDSVKPLSIEMAVHHSRLCDDTDTDSSSCTSSPTDYHFVDRDRGIMGIVDYAHPAVAHKVIDYLERTIADDDEGQSHVPMHTMTNVLNKAMKRFSINNTPQHGHNFSALLLSVCRNTRIMRVINIGSCGLLVVRDDRIVYRSYPTNSADALINYLTYTSATSNHSDFFELQENDLILAGSDGVFSNLTEAQILSFVRPVATDRIDKTLAIANNTCLGAWTSDDVDFISYYLANLAMNFATAPNSKPFVNYPFPPSPNPDDVTVLSVSCSFS